MKETMMMTVLAVSISGSLSAATIMQLDFTSDGSGDAVGYGGVNPPIGSTVGYSDFVVAELGPSGNTSANPSIVVGPATFALAGNTSAWPGIDGADTLTGDYLFIPSGASALGADPVLAWTVTGLVANTDHVFTFTPGVTTNRGVDFASGTSSVAMFGGAGDVSLTLTSDGSGQIIGTAVGTGNEGNWAALRIESVPEPSSMALLGLGGVAMILRRRK